MSARMEAVVIRWPNGLYRWDEVHRRDAEELARINDAYPGRKPA